MAAPEQDGRDGDDARGAGVPGAFEDMRKPSRAGYVVGALVILALAALLWLYRR